MASGSSTYSMRIAVYTIIAGCSVAMLMVLVTLGLYFSQTEIRL